MTLATKTAIAALLVAVPAVSSADPGFDEIWKSQGKIITSAGIDQPLARRTFHWMQVQYMLGRCKAFVPGANAEAWKNWWQGTSLGTNEMGKALVATGRQNYELGLRDGAATPPTADKCVSAFAGVNAKMAEPALGSWEGGVAPLAVVGSAAAATPAGCASYVGTKVTSRPFAEVAALLAKVPTSKGEFETTAEFSARQAAATSGWPATFVVGYKPNLEHLVYDADAGALSVKSYFFRNLNTSYFDVFGYGSPFEGKVKYGHGDNIDVVVGETERATGTYSGSNAYGASATVTKVQRDTQAIWDREATFGEKIFEGQSDAMLGSIPMSPAEARALKAGASAALVVAPRWPYFAKGTKTWTPTINRPTHVTNYISVIAADLQCALLLDSAGRVVAAYITK